MKIEIKTANSVTLRIEEEKILVVISDNQYEYQHRRLLPIAQQVLRRILQYVGLLKRAQCSGKGKLNRYVDIDLSELPSRPAAQERNQDTCQQPKRSQHLQSGRIFFGKAQCDPDYQRRVRERL